MPDFNKPSKTRKFLLVLKTILFTKFPINLFMLLLVVGVSIALFAYVNPGSMLTGVAIAECPECICKDKECPACICPELDCGKCPAKIETKTEEVVKYQCPSGSIVNSLEECSSALPEISSEYSGTVNGVSIAIDDVKIDMEDDGSGGFVKQVEYTVLNKGEFPIVPKIEVRAYKEWTSQEAKNPPQKWLNPEEVIPVNGYIQRKDDMNIWFNGDKVIVRLKLINTIPDPDEEIVAVAREF